VIWLNCPFLAAFLSRWRREFSEHFWTTKEDDMTIPIVRSVLLAAIAYGAAASMAAAAHAQAQGPSPKKDSELIAAGYKQLSGQQISALFLGNTAYAVALDYMGPVKPGGKMAIYYRDAKTRVMVPSGGPDAGKKFIANWWIEGNFLCSEGQIVREGHSCASVYELGSSVYTCRQSDGSCRVQYRVVPGNPDKF
jgi:hypothetical protein